MEASTSHPITQPGLERILSQIQRELPARSVVFLRRDGQVIAREGELKEEDVPQMAALVAAMAAASESVAELAGKPKEESRLSLEFPASGLYAVAVGKEFWVAILYDKVLNPGLLRMRARSFADKIERLHFEKDLIPDNGLTQSGIRVTPLSKSTGALFENITDDEIDGLFRRPS